MTAGSGAPGGRYPTSEALLAEAVEAAGSSDFGPGEFRIGLDVFLESLERDARLSPSTDERVLGLVRRRLVNRLRIEDWYREHPEIASLPIDGPVSIIGLPRTGTTALGNVLSVDDQFRPLRLWEQREPVPPPVLGEEDDDPRRTAALRDLEEMIPDDDAFRAMHILEMEASAEDTEVLGLEFHAQQYTMPVYGYHAWWRGTDMRPSYAYHRRVVQLLQSRRPPNRWLFKAPHHKFHLEALVAAYPDIRFVMTHRDPAKAVPSYSSLVSSIFPPPDGGELDLHRVGREVSEHLRVGMEHAVEERARVGEDRFLDVHHRDFVRDPFGTLDRIYGWLGYELRPEVLDRMRRWHEVNRVGAHGTHRYTAEQFGLSTEQLHAEYDFYLRRFDVALEA